MPIDAQIPLSVKPIEFPSPMQTIGSLMQMRGSIAEVAYKQAQAEQTRQNAMDIKAQADQRNRDLADQNTIQEAMKTPEVASAIAGGDLTGLNGKVQPKTLEALQTSVLNHHKDLATATKTDLENRSTALGTIADTAAGLKQLADPEKINAALPAAIQQLKPQFDVLKMDPAKVPSSITSVDDLDQWLAGVGAAKAANDKVLATKKETAGIAETEAKGHQAQADADLATFKLNAAKQAMSGAGAIADPESAVATLIDPKDPAYGHALAAGKLAMQGADPTVIGSRAKAFNEAVEKVYQEEVQAPKKAAAVAAAELPAQINRAVAVAKATAPIEQARAITTANTNRANAGAEKLDTEYNNAKSTTDALGKILDLADKGNKAAGSNVPLVGVETLNAINGIKRVNSAEINQYGNAGSLLDKIKGKIGGLVEGKPIPADVLSDIRELHEELGTEAYNKYTTGLRSLEQRTPGVKLPPTIPPPHIRGGSAASASIPTPTSQAEYNALAKGAQFKKPNDPKVYIKQ